MYQDPQKPYQHHRRATGWTQLVGMCTESIGGFYRSNGSILKSHTRGLSTDQEQQVQLGNLTERTLLRMKHEEMLRQVNLETILAMVGEQLPARVIHQHIDSDWARLYFNHASNICQKAMQILWAKLLIIELQHPGSISKRTLGYLKECDLNEIKAFRKVAISAFIGLNGHPFLFRACEDFGCEDPIFTEGRLLAHCVSVGLINPDAEPLPVGFRFNYMGEPQTILQGYAPKGSPTPYFVQHFSRIGSDLYHILLTLEAPRKSKIQRRLIWEYLSDFLELESDLQMQTA